MRAECVVSHHIVSFIDSSVTNVSLHALTNLTIPSATPTCSDNVQNGDETGVDCGGSCRRCDATCASDDECLSGQCVNSKCVPKTLSVSTAHHLISNVVTLNVVLVFVPMIM